MSPIQYGTSTTGTTGSTVVLGVTRLVCALGVENYPLPRLEES
jgi:hypothetical protein